MPGSRSPGEKVKNTAGTVAEVAEDIADAIPGPVGTVAAAVVEGVEFVIAHAGRPKRPDGGLAGGVRRVRGDGKRRVRADVAGHESDLFPGGGQAFARWLETEKGIDPGVKRTAEDFAGLLEEFAARPVHGHRRRGGSDHRPWAVDLRTR